ncbi:MAG: glycoside hydrolase family 88 protein [Cyclobacteriaceae bacterium]|nr:glycoside hydrolase family 88 protein [Cyclobacteriaceae bacterium SS2]
MKKSISILMTLAILIVASCNQPKEEKQATFDVDQAKAALDFSIKQYKGMREIVPDSLIPKSVKDGQLVARGIRDWVSGFYPASLWYLYEYSGDEELKAEAEKRTWLLEPLKDYTGTHDLGFMIYCPFGNAYRITGDEKYVPVIIKGSESLITRFNETAGVIKSWDWTRGDDWTFPVIIDNMMNLEMLLWAYEKSGNEAFKAVSLSHADTTMKHHYRDDYSTWHVIDYDTENGGAKGKMTHQGYSDDSAWARGQVWGLYGYTVMYRQTKDKKYLEQAKKVADFVLNHPNLPEDKIPYWDFNAPDIPNAYRDASSGAIAASALLELSGYVDESLSSFYLDNAHQMLKSLSSPAYLAKLNENGNFILMHGVGHLPGGSEIDAPLSYGDYYFIEALVRYLKMNNAFK